MNKSLKITLAVCVTVCVIFACAATVLIFGSGLDILDPSGWKTASSGAVYYRDEQGTPLTGWQTIDEKHYYFDPAEDGAMAVGWRNLGDGLYHFSSNGVLSTGWLELDGSRYYLDATGKAAIGWSDMADGRHYFQDDGSLTVGWLALDGNNYYFDTTGAMVTGWLETEDGVYYLDDSGCMVTGWAEQESGTYYFAENGLMTTGLFTLGDDCYYFGTDGTMVTGWVTIDGSRCYFDESGVMVTGWLKHGDEQYYLDETGSMVTGWLEQDSERYYLCSDGTMAKGEVVINGTSHFFTSRGKYVVLVNAWNPVPEDYETDLVTYQGYEIDASCVDALDQLLTACTDAGYIYYLNSVYRSLDHQQAIWDSRYSDYLDAGYGTAEAKKLVGESVAVPGTSEHHLGLAADIGGSEEMYAWMREHSWEYGFIVRYPDGKTDYTGIIYEPWHVRYVGVELAQELYTLNLCMEEYMEILTNE